LPEGSPDRTRLDGVLQVMGRAIDEGRCALQGLRSANRDGERLENSLERLAQELGAAAATECRVSVEGAGRRLNPIIRDEVYRVAREAVVNAFRHARAQAIAVQVEYSARGLKVLVRDDGCGIASGVLDSPREADGGLPGMRTRAAHIGARLRVRSRAGSGTEVELAVPGTVAFKDPAGPAPQTGEGA